MPAPTTTETAVPLDAFLPGNLPSAEVLAAEYETAYDHNADSYRTANETMLIARAVGDVSTLYLKSYDYDTSNSLTDALRAKKGVCTTYTAMAVALTRSIADLEIVPAIKVVRKTDVKPHLHAFFYVPGPDNFLVEADRAYEGYEYTSIDSEYPFGASEYIVRERAKKPTTAVLQVRRGPGKEAIVLRDHESAEMHSVSQHYTTFTFFLGGTGYKSFLQSVENLSADAQGRVPEIYEPGLINPALGWPAPESQA